MVVKMKKCFMFILIILSTIVIGCIFDINDDYEKSDEPTGSYTISGKAVDSSGNGIAEISVSLVGNNNLVITDANDTFTIENITSGSYTIRLEKTGLNFYDLTIDIQDADIDIGTIEEGGHGANVNGNYSCSQCH